MKKLLTLIVDLWHDFTGWEQCNEKLGGEDGLFYCQKRLGHPGKCKTCFGREFN